MTLQEEREFKMIIDGLSYCPGEKRWTAKYPFIKDPNNLPNNRKTALSMLHATDKRLRRNPKHANVCQEQVVDMRDKEACRKLTHSEI